MCNGKVEPEGSTTTRALWLKQTTQTQGRVLNHTEEFEKRTILSCILCVFRNRHARQAGRLMFLLRGKDILQRTKERPLRRK